MATDAARAAAMGKEVTGSASSGGATTDAGTSAAAASDEAGEAWSKPGGTAGIWDPGRQLGCSGESCSEGSVAR